MKIEHGGDAQERALLTVNDMRQGHVYQFAGPYCSRCNKDTYVLSMWNHPKRYRFVNLASGAPWSGKVNDNWANCEMFVEVDAKVVIGAKL